MTQPQAYDVIVIGAGSTGENVAARAVEGGLSVVLVEEDLAGGDCSYWACMPSKALLRPGEVLAAARNMAGSRAAVTGGLDVDAVLARRDSFTSHWSDAGQASWIASAGIELVRGHARLAGTKTVAVDTVDGEVTLRARHAVAVCTGSEPALPPVEGLADSRPWTTKDATSVKRVPGRLAVIGGGVAGCELATAFRAFGAEVTVFERGGRLLSHNEPFVGELLGKAFAERGITVHTGVSATEVRRDTEGVTITLDNGQSIVADEVLASAGRRPRTGDIGLGSVGLRAGSWLDVDDTLRVAGIDGGWLYAVGDVNHRALLTHMGKYQARAAGDVIAARAGGKPVDGTAWSRYTATADNAAVPQVVFTDPEVGAVGLTEAQARAAGRTVRCVEYEIGNTAGAALYTDGYSGRAKLVVDEDRQVVLGATFCGPAVGELVHAATIAVVGEVPLARLWHAVPSYPTISEIWLRLLESYGL